MTIDVLTANQKSTRRTRSLSAIDRPQRIGRNRRRTMRNRAVSAGLVALVSASLAVSADSAGAAPSMSAVSTAAGSSAAVSQNQLGILQKRVEEAPNDGSAWKSLASAYVRRAYETADPSYYPLATAALTKASGLLKNDPGVRIVRANLRLALHDFAGARNEASAVLTVQPNSFEAKIALTDATIELGDYQRAAELTEDLVGQRAGVASLSRLSYIRQLTGDILGAETAIRAAVSAAPEGSLDQGVALAYLGEVLLERGRQDAAATVLRKALSIYPASAVAAVALARIEAELGHVTKATTILNTLIERVPVPGALGLQADIARSTKNRKAEVAANQLVDASIELFRSNGAIVDAELAVLLADRGPASATAALAAADRAYAARRTIFTADAKAWALFQAGRVRDAVPFITSALSTEPAVASIHWHAALIFDATGDRSAARTELKRALINPSFSPSQRRAMNDLAKRLGLAQPAS